MSSIEKILNEFDAVSLNEMDGVRLMNRIDTKYTFSINELNSILQKLKTHYNILQIKDKRKSSYKTLYFDTKELSLYNKHHNGQLNRYKIRHRTYQESGDGFLEVKLKTNKGRTIKSRIEIENRENELYPQAMSFLSGLLPFDPISLSPTILVIYDRITLVNKKSTERLTIDVELEFVNGQIKKECHNLVIAEVKQVGKQKSPFIEAMKKLAIREGSISKYCLGIAYTNNEVKKNNFKEKINHINKLVNDNITSNS